MSIVSLVKQGYPDLINLLVTYSLELLDMLEAKIHHSAMLSHPRSYSFRSFDRLRPWRFLVFVLHTTLVNTSPIDLQALPAMCCPSGSHFMISEKRLLYFDYIVYSYFQPQKFSPCHVYCKKQNKSKLN